MSYKIVFVFLYEVIDEFLFEEAVIELFLLISSNSILLAKSNPNSLSQYF